MAQDDGNSIIVLDKFIQATRDSGYKGTISAIAELVDNSIQASAKKITITLENGGDQPEWPITVAVLDNGTGMDRTTLRQSLRFGGSSRFNDRVGLGRYGMGLPNASLSQARRVEVYSWQRKDDALFTYLDVDEIMGGALARIPDPKPRKIPDGRCARPTASGTLVVWRRCDRLDHRRINTVARKLAFALGRVFRYFLWDGLKIEVNGEPVEPVDPIYLRQPSRWTGGVAFQDPLKFEIRVPSTNGTISPTGSVTVTFTELPVSKWHDLPNEEKRALGITNGAGVSVVRGGREIDYGWHFMGGKRKENYDDWWRCEIRFDPALDEAFGITHTKQEIHPQDFLLEVLSPELEVTAKALNGRVRRAHLEAKTSNLTSDVERRAAACDDQLAPINPNKGPSPYADAIIDLAKCHPILRQPLNSGESVEYRIVEDAMCDAGFFQPLLENGRVVVVVNPRHRFFRDAYGPLLEEDSPESRRLSAVLQSLLLAAARAEGVATSAKEREVIARYRQAWSDALEVFLRE